MDVIAERRVDEGDVGGRIRHRVGLALVNRLRLAFKRETQATRLEAPGRATVKRKIAFFAGHFQAERRRLGRPASGHLDRQRLSIRKMRLHEQMVGDGPRLPLCMITDLDFRVLGRGQRSRVMERA